LRRHRATARDRSTLNNEKLENHRMKLIGAGLPRTGTLSQKLALEMLGFGPCYHMVNVLMDLSESPRWARALEDPSTVTEIFKGYESTVDWPGSHFWATAAEAYPEAKVLLSVRDADSWATSMSDTIGGLFFGDVLIRHLSDARGCVDPAWKSFMDMMRGVCLDSVLSDGAEATPDSMKAAMGRHNAEVQRTIPPERLLVWRASDGWEPLCTFLGVPVPDAPFPRVNDAEEFKQRIIDQSIAAVQKSRAAAGAAVAA
jgi:Sulfotransferase domain